MRIINLLMIFYLFIYNYFINNKYIFKLTLILNIEKPTILY